MCLLSSRQRPLLLLCLILAGATLAGCSPAKGKKSGPMAGPTSYNSKSQNNGSSSSVPANPEAKKLAAEANSNSIQLYIRNAASYGNEVAPGSQIAIFGFDLTTETIGANVPFPTELNQTSVLVNGIPAPLVFVSPWQVNAILPEDLPLGEASVQLRRPNGPTLIGSMPVMVAAPGIFTTLDNGKGIARGYTWSDFGWGSLADPLTGLPRGVDPGSAEHPNYLVLYGTGLRGLPQDKIVATIEGFPAEVAYAGPQGEYPGLDQINIIVPPWLGTEMARILTVRIRAGNLPANEVQFKMRGRGPTADTPDATEDGPNAVTESEYHLPAQIDSTVLDFAPTELWAKIYRPQSLSSNQHPVLMFLHGNHATCGQYISQAPGQPRYDNNCQYTSSGSCPAGYVVAPSHEGYAYLARKLASWGYIVVSINANLGINCNGGTGDDFGLIQARGRLVLRHLQLLSQWNRFGGTPGTVGTELFNRLDFSQVGLFGHSRGGEGVRAAYNLYRDAGSPWPARISTPVSFAGIFELAPTDQLSMRTFDVQETPWNVLLPLCDGDVSNMAGMRPLDRALARMAAGIQVWSNPTMSSWNVWGANHNFYNTEWQLSDSGGCQGTSPLWSPSDIGSASQRATSSASVLAFFRGYVGPNADARFTRAFDPAFRLPSSAASVTRIEREFVRKIRIGLLEFLELFDQAPGTSTRGFANQKSNVSVGYGSLSPHDAARRAGRVQWTSASYDNWVQFNFANPESGGMDFRSLNTLDFSVSRSASPFNQAGVPTDFSVALVDMHGRVSNPVPVSTYGNVQGPVGEATRSLHSLLGTIRVPLSDIVGVDQSHLSGVRFIFNRTDTGEIYLASIRATNAGDLPEGLLTTDPENASTTASRASTARKAVVSAAMTVTPRRKFGAIARVQRGARAWPTRPGSSSTDTGYVEIEISSTEGFPVLDSLPILNVGEQQVKTGRYPANGDTRRMIFTLRTQDLDALPARAPVTLSYGDTSPTLIFDLGQLPQ